MLQGVVVLGRWAQYLGAMILFGSSLFFLYALPPRGAGSAAEVSWAKPLLGWSAGALAFMSLVGLFAQTSILAGSVAAAVQPDALSVVVFTTSFGPSSMVRMGAALAAAAATLVVLPGRKLWAGCALLGAVACASFAWMGHGAANDGAPGLLHASADILHALAAGVWVGALAVLLGLLFRRDGDPELDRLLHRSLHGFSGIGSGLVAVLLVTGVVNGVFTVGPGRLAGLWSTAYGRLLALKLLLFAGMLGLAAANRFRLTPRLAAALDDGAASVAAVKALRHSVTLETGLAFAVLGLVAWFGALAPVSAGGAM